MKPALSFEWHRKVPEREIHGAVRIDVAAHQSALHYRRRCANFDFRTKYRGGNQVDHLGVRLLVGMFTHGRGKYYNDADSFTTTDEWLFR